MCDFLPISIKAKYFYNQKERNMNEAFEKNMRIIAGENMHDNQSKQLSEQDKNKLSESYFKLFFNLTYNNWLRGKKLGESWYTALNQLEQFITSKKSNNPASLYLRQIFASNKTKWAQVMMTSKHRDDVLQPTPEQKQNWNQIASKNISNALTMLNETIKAYTPTEQMTFKKATQQIPLWFLQKQRQKGMAS